jgi:predicted DNA-binding protein
MSMSLEHRLQVLIDDDRHRRLTDLAAARGVSVATIVREAIDRGLTSPDDQRRAAGKRILAAETMDVPEPDALRDELDALRSRRG